MSYLFTMMQSLLSCIYFKSYRKVNLPHAQVHKRVFEIQSEAKLSGCCVMFIGVKFL